MTLQTLLDRLSFLFFPPLYCEHKFIVFHLFHNEKQQITLYVCSLVPHYRLSRRFRQPLARVTFGIRRQP